jgi:serine/threonine protein phosphatase PrpC
MKEKTNNSSLFGIFDGHGGCAVSKFAAANFNSLFKKFYSQDNNVENSLIKTYLYLDELLVNDEIDEILKKIHKTSEKLGFDISNYNQNTGIFSNISLKNDKDDNSSLNLTNSSLFSDDYNFNSDNDLNDQFSTGLNSLSKGASMNRQQQSQKKNYNNLKNYDINYGMHKNKDYLCSYMGSTANIVFIEGNSIYVANVGDSYSVMYKDNKAIKLNNEHKTSDRIEHERIISSGSFIVNDRVEGRLNLTRAIGKKFIINIFF